MGKVLTFYLRGGLFGIDIRLVKEIDRNMEYTPVPDSKEHIVGLINLRGQIVTLIDLAKLMKHQCEMADEKITCVVLKNTSNDSDQMGFLIDRSGDVIDIADDDYEQPPANIENIDAEYIKSVVELKDELLMIINTHKLFEN